MNASLQLPGATCNAFYCSTIPSFVRMRKGLSPPEVCARSKQCAVCDPPCVSFEVVGTWRRQSSRAAATSRRSAASCLTRFMHPINGLRLHGWSRTPRLVRGCGRPAQKTLGVRRLALESSILPNPQTQSQTRAQRASKGSVMVVR